LTDNKKIELLAPAGNFEKLETAIHYGADAVYLSGKSYSLRNYAGNFSLEEMAKGIQRSHDAGVRVYIAVNAFARPHEMPAIQDYLEKLKAIRPDALIIADPGIIMLANKIMPETPIHLSTQANTTNQWSARLWAFHGVTRINVARELNLEVIRAIGESTDLEIEAFAHGAMCIAYSGRCLLSSFMAKRDSNRGECAHPCRWKYAVVEELRPGQYMPVMEDDRGTYIFNSKDLCMINYIPEMIDAGITSLKIEGRLKGLNYLAVVVKSYREAIDAYYQCPQDYRVEPEWATEIARIGPRGYCTGFYLNDPEAILADYENSAPRVTCRFVGKIIQCLDAFSIKIEVRNKIQTGDFINILKVQGTGTATKVTEVQTLDGLSVETAQSGMQVVIRLDRSGVFAPNDIIRKIE